MAKTITPKYRIAELADAMPQTVRVAHTLNTVGITPSTYSRHRKIKAGSHQSISGDHLKIYSEFFGVPIDSLFTPTTQSIKRAVKLSLKTALS